MSLNQNQGVDKAMFHFRNSREVFVSWTFPAPYRFPTTFSLCSKTETLHLRPSSVITSLSQTTARKGSPVLSTHVFRLGPISSSRIISPAKEPIVITSENPFCHIRESILLPRKAFWGSRDWDVYKSGRPWFCLLDCLINF